MILGLKIHMENINMYMYLCTNFQEHWYLDTEDTHTRVITKLSIFLVFFVYFSPLLQLCLPLTNKIAQKWPTTSHRR